MKNQRRILCALGALTGLALVWGVSLVLASPRAKHHSVHHCLPYFLIPQEIVCSKNVYWINPDGSKVLMGRTKDLHAMPRAVPDKRHS